MRRWAFLDPILLGKQIDFGSFCALGSCVLWVGIVPWVVLVLGSFCALSRFELGSFCALGRFEFGSFHDGSFLIGRFEFGSF